MEEAGTEGLLHYILRTPRAFAPSRKQEGGYGQDRVAGDIFLVS
jgi:hypothetical protein